MEKRIKGYRSFYMILTTIVLFLIMIPTTLLNAQTEQLKGLDEYIEKAMLEWQVPGLAIAIVKDDQVIYNKGFGVRDFNIGKKVDTNTQFAIASNTKAFTVHALGLLVQEEKISWDDPVIKYLTDFQLYDPVVTRKITIRDLLCHRSGLGTWAGDFVWWGANFTREYMMDRIRFIKPAAEFRSTYMYNNLMFMVAGEVIKAVTGISWDEYLKKRFFNPLKMASTNTSTKDLDLTKNVALPHTIRDDKVVQVPYVNVDISAPAGAINSCTSDMAKWLRLQLANGKFEDKQIINPDIIAEIRKSHIVIPVSDKAKKINPYSHLSTYALGWRLRDYKGKLMINHGGGLDGMYSVVGMIPDENIGVVILTNLDNHNLQYALSYHVFDRLLDFDRDDWSKKYIEAARVDRSEKEKSKTNNMKIKGTKPSHLESDYFGKYISNLYGEAEIYIENQKMKMQLKGHPGTTGVLEHWQYDTFIVKWSDVVWNENPVYFDIDDQGKIKQFRMSVRPDWIDTLEYTFVKAE